MFGFLVLCMEQVPRAAFHRRRCCCRPIEKLRFICRKSFSPILLLLFQFVFSTIFINYLLTLLHKPMESSFKCYLNISNITKWDETINYVVPEKKKRDGNVVEVHFQLPMILWFSSRKYFLSSRLLLRECCVVEKWFVSGQLHKVKRISISVLMWFRANIFPSHPKNVEIKGSSISCKMMFCALKRVHRPKMHLLRLIKRGIAKKKKKKKTYINASD